MRTASVTGRLRRGYPTLGGSILLGAHPAETDASVERALQAARDIDAALPAGLGLAYAAGGRVYEAAPLGAWVRAHLDAARPHLVGRLSPHFIEPLVFCRPGPPRALLARVTAGLEGCRGQMAPLNAEAPATPQRLRAELHVNLGVVRAAQGQTAAGLRSLRAALRLAPDHPEALRQIALTLANVRGDRAGAAAALRRLRAVAATDQRPEIDAALAALTRSRGPTRSRRRRAQRGP